MSDAAPGLTTQPSATTYELGQIVPWAWQGRIRVPHFQRDFRWQLKDVLRLFDSIVRGYPVGNLLLWVRKSPAENIKLGQLRIDAPAHDEALWVVDGQQRLTSLANALHFEGNKHEPFNVVYDLARGEFVEAPKNGMEPHHIDVPTLFDGRRLLAWFRNQGPEVEDYYDKADEVSTKLRQYKVPAYLVRHDDLEVLTDIFDRMNNYGRRLNRAEIFTALNSGAEEGAEERLDFSRIADNVASRTLFGTIDVNTVLAAFLARRGPDPTRDIRTEFSPEARRVGLEFPAEDEQTAYREAEEALVRAVTFLIETAGVPHIALLPYRAQLVVLTRFFAHFPEPAPNTLRLLRRLFWRLAIAGPSVFRGSFTQFSRILSNKIRPGDEEGSTQALLETMKGAVSSPPSPDRFRTNEATAKIVLNAWWSLRPRSLATGVQADVQSLSSVLGDEQTPVGATPYIFSKLNESGEKKMRLWAANRLFLPFAEDMSEISRMITRWRADVDEATQKAILDSHLIDDRTLDALIQGDRTGFLQMRQQRIRAQLRDFLDRMSEWKYEDTPSLKTLEMGDEEEEPDIDFSDDRLR